MLDVDFRSRVRVRWQDTDAFGQVRFSGFLRMMEETEYAFLRSRGLSVVMQDERGVIGFPRLSADLQLHQPARLDEELDIWLQLVDNDGIKLTYRFEVAGPGDVVASGCFVAACCRFPPGKPPRAILIPDFFMQRLSQDTGNRRRDD
jgi:YbgC/YbaW family acyl-CoA thioester hydrolase